MHQAQIDLLNLAERENISNFSLRALGKLIGVKHPQAVKHHIANLQKKGLLCYDGVGHFKKTSGGSIEKGVANIPMIKDLTYSEELLGLDNMAGFFKIAVGILSPQVLNDISKIIVVKAQNNVMNRVDVKGLTIEEGDFILVKLDTSPPRSGELILSSTQGFAAVRRYVKDDLGQVVLVSESSEDYPPIYLDANTEHLVFGRIVQIIKRPHIYNGPKLKTTKPRKN